MTLEKRIFAEIKRTAFTNLVLLYVLVVTILIAYFYFFGAPQVPTLLLLSGAWAVLKTYTLEKIQVMILERRLRKNYNMARSTRGNLRKLLLHSATLALSNTSKVLRGDHVRSDSYDTIDTQAIHSSNVLHTLSEEESVLYAILQRYHVRS